MSGSLLGIELQSELVTLEQIRANEPDESDSLVLNLPDYISAIGTRLDTVEHKLDLLLSKLDELEAKASE